MGVLIKNGDIVTAIDRFTGDILCRDGTIAAIGKDLEGASGDTVVDASGQLVMPGGIDPHVHMELPFMGTVSADDFESGTAAGVAGGTTTIIDFVIPNRNQSLMEALAEWKEKSAKSVADYAYHMAVTWFTDQVAREMTSSVEEHGIPTFKIFMAYRGAIGVDDTELIHVLETAKKLGALVLVHAEHGEMVLHLQKKLLAEGHTEPKYHAVSRPSYVEGEATHRVIQLAREFDQPLYIVHMTCRESLEAVHQARMRGEKIFGETCPQYLLLDDSVYEKPDFEGAAYVMSPPIRPAGHQEALWAGLTSGQLQVVGTDHCPFRQEQKRMGEDDFTKIPNGAAGVENRLGLLYTYGVAEGRFDLHRLVQIFSTTPAKIMGLYPRKGSLAVGADADIVVYDPASESTISAKTHKHKVDRNIFEGFEVKGKPSHVIVNSRVQYVDGDLRVERGAGRYIPRSPLYR